MKNKIKFVLLFLFVIFGCCACNGNITRNIRHAGFSLSNTTFVCDALTPSDKEDTTYEKIKYLDNSFAVTEDGNIYELSLGQKYSNDQNCKKAEFDKEVIAILDNKIVKCSDNKFYYTSGQSNSAVYSEVTVTDNSYRIYELLLSDPANLKAVTVDQGTGTYYVLKTDGNVYQYIIDRKNTQSDYNLVSSDVIYSKSIFSRIIDFDYNPSAPTTSYLKTEREIYRILPTNKEECSKYADVECNYELSFDETLSEYYDKILGYNGNLLITTYSKQFTASQ